MSISNHSVDLDASTPDLEAQHKSYAASLEAADDDQAEWLESGMELIEAELDRRAAEAELAHEAEQDRQQVMHDEMIDDAMAQDGRWG
jgi:hypothetical protein